MRDGIYFNVSVPKFCANCGEPFNFTKPYQAEDLLAGASQSCNSCDTTFVHIEESENLSEKVLKELNNYR